VPVSSISPVVAIRTTVKLFNRSARLERSFSILLLIGGVKRHSGPANIRCGLLNVRYAHNKAALIHDIIDDNNLDLLM